MKAETKIGVAVAVAAFAVGFAIAPLLMAVGMSMLGAASALISVLAASFFAAEYAS